MYDYDRRVSANNDLSRIDAEIETTSALIASLEAELEGLDTDEAHRELRNTARLQVMRATRSLKDLRAKRKKLEKKLAPKTPAKSIGVREKYSDGHIIPLPGDEVFKEVRGYLTGVVRIYGVVTSGGKKVKTLGSGDGILGIQQAGKLLPLDTEWIWVDDPKVKAAQLARDEERAEFIQHQVARREAVAHWGHVHGLTPIEDQRDLPQVTSGDNIVIVTARSNDPANRFSHMEAVVMSVTKYLLHYEDQHGHQDALRFEAVAGHNAVGGPSYCKVWLKR